MSISGQAFIRRFEQYCPLWLAEEGDPVGLHIGSLDKPIAKVMMTLDVRPAVVQEAIEKKVDLIIAKHPPIFRPIKRLLATDPQQKMYLELAKHDIAVYAAHTNMDIIEDGLNDWFCEVLDIDVENYLLKTHEVSLQKLIVFVPRESQAALRQALADSGAGTLGNYQATSFTSEGVGRFTPMDDAQPTIGEIGQAETVAEVKIEVVFPETKQKEVLAAMVAAHPYEEIAYDLVNLANQKVTYGIGRVGSLAEPIAFEEFVKQVKQVFALDGVKVILPNSGIEKVQKIAICGGSGSTFFMEALKQQADVYLTGDVTYHTAHDMQETPMAVIDPGHHIEVLCIPRFIEKMNSWKVEEGWDVEFIAATTDTNPFQYR
ncbi:MAG: Nif3-like dinuclear metal center hexameric protein [Enterococcus sp.]